MHAYLIISKNLQAFLFTNLQKAKEKEAEFGECFIYEWMDLWCRPMDFTKGSDTYGDLVDIPFPWEMLIKAYEQGNWSGRCKYREEQFKDMIERLSK